MSSRGTGTSSLMQMYCCFRREPQSLCSRLNEIARLASVAEYSFTGMDTSPKETVNDAIDLAAIVRLPSELGVGASQCLLEALLPLQRVMPAVARLRQALHGI